MANYLNKEGISYTQEEIEAAALENNVDVDTILADNELSLEGEKPGKPQGATAKKPAAAPKKPKSVSSLKKPSSASSGKPVFPTISTPAQDIVDTFQKKKKVQEKKAAVKKAEVKKSKAVVNNFVDTQPDLANPFDTTIKADVTDPFNTGVKLDVSNIQSDYLGREDKKAMQFINSSVNIDEANSKLNDELNDSQAIDYVREGAKEYYNELIANPLTEVAGLFGADIDIKMAPYKPLENEKKQAREELAKKGIKITNEKIEERAKSIYIDNQILDQKGKAAEEYFDTLDDDKLKDQLKIKAIADKLNASDKARQYTMLSKVYDSQIKSFGSYANDIRKKYNDGSITPEELAEYKVKAKEAKEAYGYLENIYKDFPKVEKQLKTDTEKLDFYKLNYDDVEGNLKRLYASGLKVLGGTLKIGGESAKFLEESITGNISPIGTGTNLSTIGGLMLEDAEAETRDLKSITFESVSNFNDFGKYMGNLFSDQIPIYASMYFGGSAGAGAVSLSSGGQKIQEMENEVGANYSLGTKLLTGYAYATAEFIPEKIGTLRMFENLKGTMTSVGKESRELFKDGLFKSAIGVGGKTAMESTIEGGTEGLTELLDMAIDEHLLGKEFTAQTKVKRIKEAVAGGVFMAGPMQAIGGANTLIAKELKNYATENEIQESKKIIDRIDFLQNELATNASLSSSESNQIKQEISNLSDTSIGIIENSQDRVYNMTTEDMIAVVNINKEQANLKNKYTELIDSNFSNEIKVEKANELNKEFKVLEKERQRLLTEKYAEINKVVNNSLVINDSIENITKIANSIGKVDFDNKIGDQAGIAVFNSREELGKAYKEWLVKDNKNEDGSEKMTMAQIDSEVKQGINSDGFKLPNGQIVINKAVAANIGAINVVNHEFLHKILESTFRDKKQGAALVNQFLNVLSTKERAAIQKRIDENYRYFKDESGNIVEKNFEDYAEEYLNVFIDEIKYENIKDKDNIKQLLIRIARPILKYLRKLGFNKIEFESGEDVYQFLKSYQKNISKGRISERAKKLIAQEQVEGRVMFSKSIEERMDKLDAQLSNNEIDLDKYEIEMQKLEQEDFEASKKAYEEEKTVVKKEPSKNATTKKEPTEISEAAAKAKAKLDAIGNDPKGFNPNNPAIYDELDKMVKVKSRNYRTANGTIIDLTNKNKGGLDGFNMEEMTSYVTVSMLPYIQKFDPSKNDSLYGYINAQLANRMKAALKSGQVADVVFTEDVSEMTKLSNEEVEVKSISLPERKRFQNILESGVFSPDVIESVQAKMMPLVRTLESKFNEKTTLNKTVSPLIREIKNYIGTQADIDIKKAMGGKEDQVLQNWLITNKKTVLENLPTTWLMGKDNGKTVSGGMPFAIQKQVNGRWLNYPDWIGKKVDRESVSTDLAGRTSGHELVRRLPEVNKNVSVEEFLSAIIDLKNGDVIRGRKESLAKVMSEELTLDILIDDFLNDGPLFQLFVKNQEAKGILRDDIIINDIVRQSERGNVKFSLTQQDFDSIRINSLEIAERIQDIDNINSTSIAQALTEIGWEENRIAIVAKALAGPLARNRKFFGEDEFLENTAAYLQGFENEKDYGERMYQVFNTKRRVATIFKGTTGKRTVEMLRKKNAWFGKAVIKKYGQEKGLQLLKSFWSPTVVNSDKGGVKIYNNVKEFNDFLEDIQISLQDRKNLSKKATINNVINASDIKAEFRRPNSAFENMFNGEFDPKKDIKKTDAAKDFLIFAAEWWADSMKNKESVYSAAMFTMLFKDKHSLGKAAAPVVGVIKDGEFKPGAYIFEHTVPGRHIAYLLAKKIYLKDNSMSYEDIFNDYNVLIVPEKISIALDASGVKDMVAPFHYFPFIKKNTFTRYDAQLVRGLINNNIQLYQINKVNTANEKAATNNLNQSKKSISISTVSNFINANNLKRIDAETSFDVLNDLNKEIENYWGIVPNDVIVKMGRAVDYAFDVIEDRENEGGPLMAAVNDALNLETVKFAEKQLNEFVENNRPKGTMYSKTLDFEFNDILERNTGVAAFTKVSDVVAKRTGIKKNTLSFFVPPSADDFRGLTTYMFAGKGKQGEQDQEFFDKNLTVPYVKGINTLDSVRQSIRKEYKMLLNNFPDIKKKLEKLTPDKGFTYDQAVRVYLWSSTGKEVPGLSRTDKNKLLYFVKQNPDLLAFTNALSITGRQDGGWIDPSTTWDSETIISDLHNITEGAGRKKYLEEFIENADAIFTKENLNKIQSIYGTNTREALEDSLYRMKNGKNRPEGTDRVTNTWMNWINGSTAAIMFFNTRSALLQTISAINFINWNDNNPYMAGKAFLNQKQYWSDFAMIINSDKLKERRSGLKADVTQAEIANAANSAKNKFNGVISYLQKIGFTPTQAADSFSIAVSGATFYRNRVNTYLKAGDTVEVAEEKAFNDFSIITDQSMQSADPMYVSKQQTTALGRIILAFGNTPMQYNRLIKKATLDLANRRGDWKTNVSKIVYYGALQNILFSALQSALFIPLGYDDDEEPDTSKMTKEEKKAYEKLKKKGEDKISNMINGMADTLLRGSGVYGAAIATVKNTIMEYFKQEEKEMFADHAYTVLALTSVSPPISSKARKLYGSIRISKFEKDVIAERGWEVTRDGKLNLAPNYRILGNVTVATTNLPLDRVVEKVNNMAEVMDSRNTKLQRGALALGWKDWELNVKNEENEIIKATAKVKRKEEGIEKAIETRKANKAAEKEKFNRMSTQEKIAFRLKKAKEKREKRIKKRKMG
jgi:hypothetical protein